MLLLFVGFTILTPHNRSLMVPGLTRRQNSDEMSVVNAHLLINKLPVKFSVCVNEGQTCVRLL